MSYISFITHVPLFPTLLLNCSLIALSAEVIELNKKEENSKCPSQTLLSTEAKPSSPQL